MLSKVLVLGAGSWGVTLANLLAEKKCKVNLWEFDPAQAEYLNKKRVLRVLPGVKILDSIIISSDLAELTEEGQACVIAVPSQFFRSALKNLKGCIKSITKPVISVTKGIEQVSLFRMSEIIAEEIPAAKNYEAVLSGPSHAEEVSRRIPTAVVCACNEKKIADEIQALFFTKYFRVYTQQDIIGVELGGALKNIYAIGAGICDGLGLGDNTKAALLTRGLAEMIRLGKVMGGNEITFAGLSGLGDLMVTCFSRHSRNRLLGEKIGSGKSVKASLAEMTMVSEGYPTAKSAYELGKKFKIELPIINEIYETLYKNKNPRHTVEALMGRTAKSEVMGAEAYFLEERK